MYLQLNRQALLMITDKIVLSSKAIVWNKLLKLTLVFLMLDLVVASGAMALCYYQDSDGDGYGNPDVYVCGVQLAGYVIDNTDCDDTNTAINPGATEICDDIDNNCDGNVDDCGSFWYQDLDSDGYGNAAVWLESCTQPSGFISDSTDCNDSNSNIHPNAVDICENGFDEDCDGIDRNCESEDYALPIVVLLLDSSASMTWEILVPTQPDALYRGCCTVACAVSAKYWEVQWCKKNTIYYDPTITYQPWKGTSVRTGVTYANADLYVVCDHPDQPPVQALDAARETGNRFFGVTLIYASYFTWSSLEQKPYLIQLEDDGSGGFRADYYEVTTSAADPAVISNVTLSASPPSDVLIPQASALDARQNFANWYDYYHSRILSISAALGRWMDEVSGIQLGLNTIGVNSDTFVLPLLVNEPPTGEAHREVVRSAIYAAGLSESSTDLRKNFEDTGEYLMGNTYLPMPWAAADEGGASQLSFTVLLTDALYSDSTTVCVGDADGDNDTMFDGPPFADAYGQDNTLADIAMYYYEHDLVDWLADETPTTEKDTAEHQHMITYAISFGGMGTLDPNAYLYDQNSSNCSEGAECSAESPCSCAPFWPLIPETQYGEPEKIDDLYHSAVNGRGEYYSSHTVAQLYNGLEQMLSSIQQRSTPSLTTEPANLINWSGNLVADFGDNGLWYNNGTSWNWMSNSGHVGQMLPWDGKLVVDFGSGKGLWYYDITSWHWMTNNSEPNMMIAWSNGFSEKLVVDYGKGNRIYTYDGAWNWFSNKDGVADMTVWNNKLIVDLGSGRGMYNYDTSWHWMTNKDDVNLMLPWDNGTTEKLVVDFGGGRRIYTYDGAWNWFTNKDDVNDMTVWNQKLVVDFGGGRCLYNYDISWHWMNNKDDVARMVTWRDAGTDLAVDFGSGQNIYNYNGAWAWIRNANDVPEMLAWNNRLAVDFGPGVGVYNYNGSWHQMKDWSTAD